MPAWYERESSWFILLLIFVLIYRIGLWWI
jgi:hypothetical protein